MPLLVTLIDEVVAVVFHRKVALVEVSVSISVAPAQSVVSLPKLTTGGAFWASTIVSLATPHILESCPQYKPGEDTVMLSEVSPVLHL